MASANIGADAIPGGATALRRTRIDDVRRDGRVKKHAFLPSLQGKDADGLSVSIQSDELAEAHRRFFNESGKRAVSVIVASVRALELDVISAPKEYDSAHALITGIPDPLVDKVGAERKAEELAKTSRPYDFPSYSSDETTRR